MSPKIFFISSRNGKSFPSRKKKETAIKKKKTKKKIKKKRLLLCAAGSDDGVHHPDIVNFFITSSRLIFNKSLVSLIGNDELLCKLAALGI
jgi:hypothetical protein